jgi:Galactose oxidase, central domain/Kelch motif
MKTIINPFSPLSLLLVCLSIAPLSVSGADPVARGAWTFTDNMHDARQQHTATLLLDGRVLVAGGTANGISLHSAELYDPNTGVWSLTGSLHEGRSSHTATLLRDGRVLVTGGLTYDFPQRVLKSAEFYDPATGVWSQTGDMGAVREFHTATLLSNGKVLVVGGAGNVRNHQAELYDSDTGTWSFTGAMAQAIAFQTATLLQDGEVLIAGGVLGNGEVSHVAVLYDIANGLWNQTDNLAHRRYLQTATLLTDGTVLVAGGFNYDPQYHFLRSAELYNPLSATWLLTRPLHDARASHTATLLSSGKVLVAGGGTDVIQTTTCEEYDPISQTWVRTGPLNVLRVLHTATLLPNGKVLAAGGGNLNGWLASAELFDPNANP